MWGGGEEKRGGEGLCGENGEMREGDCRIVCGPDIEDETV